MTEQDEESKERLRRKFTTPNPEKVSLARNYVLDYKLKRVGTGGRRDDTNLASVLMRTFCIGPFVRMES